jgi:hypothetical protein
MLFQFEFCLSSIGFYVGHSKSVLVPDAERGISIEIELLMFTWGQSSLSVVNVI